MPTAYAHRDVAGMEELRIVYEDSLIAQHPRCWGRDQTFFEPIHYLALLERKLGGFDFARPLAGWDLPVAFGIWRRQLEAGTLQDSWGGMHGRERLFSLLEERDELLLEIDALWQENLKLRREVGGAMGAGAQGRGAGPRGP